MSTPLEAQFIISNPHEDSAVRYTFAIPNEVGADYDNAKSLIHAVALYTFTEFGSDDSSLTIEIFDPKPPGARLAG